MMTHGIVNYPSNADTPTPLLAPPSQDSRRSTQDPLSLLNHKPLFKRSRRLILKSGPTLFAYTTGSSYSYETRIQHIVLKQRQIFG